MEDRRTLVRRIEPKILDAPFLGTIGKLIRETLVTEGQHLAVPGAIP